MTTTQEKYDQEKADREARNKARAEAQAKIEAALRAQMEQGAMLHDIVGDHQLSIVGSPIHMSQAISLKRIADFLDWWQTAKLRGEL